jgi:hypothetical protein
VCDSKYVPAKKDNPSQPTPKTEEIKDIFSYYKDMVFSVFDRD